MRIQVGIVGLLAILFFVLGMSYTEQLTQEGYEEQKKSPWDTVGMIAVAIILAVLVYYVVGLIFITISSMAMWSNLKSNVFK